MVQNPEKPFCTILGWPFSGDVLEFMLRTYFGEMEQHRMPQTDGAKDGRGSWEAVLRNSWFDVFGGCFEFCSADLLKKNNIQYSTIEFKVISIIYITEFAHYEPRRKRPDSGT